MEWFQGASAIKCCYAARGIRATGGRIDVAELPNTKAIALCDKRVGDDVKSALNVSLRWVSPACMAGVRISRPNFKALCGRTKL